MARAEMIVTIRDFDRTRLFLWELRQLQDGMRLMASPHADRLDRYSIDSSNPVWMRTVLIRRMDDPIGSVILGVRPAAIIERSAATRPASFLRPPVDRIGLVRPLDVTADA